MPTPVRRTKYLITIIFLVMVAGLLSVPHHRAVAQDTSTVKIESANPFSGDPEAIKAGAKLYFKFCVSCHGVKADGVSRFGAYAGNLTKFWRGFGEFIAIVTAGRVKKGMPPWGEYLTGRQIINIAAFLETVAVKGANWK